MNRNRSKNIKGKGWNGIAIELEETENFDIILQPGFKIIKI